MMTHRTTLLTLLSLGFLACGRLDSEPESGVAQTAEEAPCIPGSTSHGPRLHPGETWAKDIQIPPACTVVTIKLWGPGGGNGSGVVKGYGGGGGFTQVTLTNPALWQGAYDTLRLFPDGGDNIRAARVNVLHGGYWGPMIAVAGGGGYAGVALAGQIPGNGGGAERDGSNGTLGTKGWAATGTAPGRGGKSNGCSGTGPSAPYGGGFINPGQGGHAGGSCNEASRGGDGYFGGGQGGDYSTLGSAGGGGGGSNFIWPDHLKGETIPGGTTLPGNPDDPDRCQDGVCDAGNGATPMSVKDPDGVPGRVVVSWQ